MKETKMNYVTPVTKLLVVRFERVICQSPLVRYGGSGAAGDSLDLDSSENDYGEF